MFLVVLADETEEFMPMPIQLAHPPDNTISSAELRNCPKTLFPSSPTEIPSPASK